MIQRQYLQTKGLPTHKNQAETGMKALTKVFMLYARQRWDTRNDAAHTTKHDKSSYKHTRLVLELKHLHKQRENMLIEDRVLLDHHPAKFDTMKTHQIQKLIRTIAPIVRQSKQEAKKLGKRQRKITTYYRPQKRRLQIRSQIIRSFPPPKYPHPTRPPPEPDP